MDEKRLKIVTAGMGYAMACEHRRHGLIGDVVAELWMIPLEVFPDDDDPELFRRVSAYVKYDYGYEDEPEWIKDVEFAENW